MHYAHAYERRAQALQQVPLGRGSHQPTRPPSSTTEPGQPPPATPATVALAATRTFRRLTPAEQLERRRQGLCFNCDEPYVPGHVCPRLFYLETVDYTEETLADELGELPADPAAEPVPATTTAKAFVVSLHAMAGLHDEHTMLLPVTIHG